MENKKKKRYGIVAALLLLVLAAGVGTYAWLSATDFKKNEFTVGSIDKPEVKPDPEHPDKPGTVPTDPSVDGYLFENKWNPSEEHKMIPGSSMDKNPNVGIGKDSDPSYVFIYVKNAIVNEQAGLGKTPYFTIENNWKMVEGEFEGKAVTNGTANQYVSGLFVYTNNTGDPAALEPADGKAAYTGELFSTVHIPNTLNSKDVVQDPAMTVSCYIFGADQKGEGATPAANAVEQAKIWAAQKARA